MVMNIRDEDMAVFSTSLPVNPKPFAERLRELLIDYDFNVDDPLVKSNLLMLVMIIFRQQFSIDIHEEWHKLNEILGG